jgi:hypothetical protein
MQITRRDLSDLIKWTIECGAWGGREQWEKLDGEFEGFMKDLITHLIDIGDYKKPTDVLDDPDIIAKEFIEMMEDGLHCGDPGLGYIKDAEEIWPFIKEKDQEKIVEIIMQTVYDEIEDEVWNE